MKRGTGVAWFEDTRREYDQSLIKGLEHAKVKEKHRHERTSTAGMVLVQRGEKRIHKALW